MMCFRLKSSPPKKTLRLRLLFFFMGARAHIRRGGDGPDKPNHPDSRNQLERVLRGTGQEGGGVPPDPRLVALPEVGGERVGALAPRHLEYPILLAARGDDEPFARA